MQTIVEQINALKRAGRRRVQIYEALVMEQEAGKTSSVVNGKEATISPRKD